MENFSLAMTGVAFLVITALALYKFAAREGAPPIAWLQRESIAMTVTLTLIVVAMTGLGLIIRAIA